MHHPPPGTNGAHKAWVRLDRSSSNHHSPDQQPAMSIDQHPSMSIELASDAPNPDSQHSSPFSTCRSSLDPYCSVADIGSPSDRDECGKGDHTSLPHNSYSHNPYRLPPKMDSHSTPAELTGRKHLHHRRAVFQLARPAISSTDSCPQAHVGSVVHPEKPLQPRPMCCYFKQKGFCKMGEACWYAHEGSLYTPCHYGASCKAGHATLTRMQSPWAQAPNGP